MDDGDDDAEVEMVKYRQYDTYRVCVIKFKIHTVCIYSYDTRIKKHISNILKYGSLGHKFPRNDFKYVHVWYFS